MIKFINMNFMSIPRKFLNRIHITSVEEWYYSYENDNDYANITEAKAKYFEHEILNLSILIHCNRLEFDFCGLL